ncbi:MAG: NUDIX hydrolase [Clostridia bacterium]|nr:NUDIX hydrolase [Clostridia bacterium]
MEFYDALKQYCPKDVQEQTDKAVILHCLEHYADVYERSNLLLHVTASAWITNEACDRVLMIYHNIYDSWAWTGGHADGERDLLKVALKEAREETGLFSVRPASERLLSIETLTVNPHMKRGKFVPAHLHLNGTYLLIADDSEPLRIKADENSAVKWFLPDEAIKACSEPWMRPVYQRLNERMISF